MMPRASACWALVLPLLAGCACSHALHDETPEARETAPAEGGKPDSKGRSPWLPDHREGLAGMIGPFWWARAADLGADVRFCDGDGRPDPNGEFLWTYQFLRGTRKNPPIPHLHERSNLESLDPDVAYGVQLWHVLSHHPLRNNLKVMFGYKQIKPRFEHGDNNDLAHELNGDRVIVFLPISRPGNPAAFRRDTLMEAGLCAAIADQTTYIVNPDYGAQSPCVIEFKAMEHIQYGWFKPGNLHPNILYDLAPLFAGDNRLSPGVLKPMFRFTLDGKGGWSLRYERDGRDGLAGGQHEGDWDVVITDKSPGARPYTVDVTTGNSTWAMSIFSPGAFEESTEAIVKLTPFSRATGQPVPWPERARRRRTMPIADLERALAAGATVKRAAAEPSPRNAPAAKPKAVQVRIEDRTYPVVANERSKWTPVPKLLGKETYTTPAVVMENEYLCLIVLPEFAGRLVEVKFKPNGQDLFWRCDKLNDRGPGRMGGGHWSFPFWEHCRHFGETCGYTIVRHPDGGATLAMDMRLDEYLKPEETTRYGRATNMRLAQSVRLDPGRAALVWSARVENPLPIRYGFKLWWLLRQNAVGGIHVLMPSAAVTGHGAPKLVPWDQNTAIREGLVNSLFSIGIRHDFAGWYLPEQDMNVLRLQDRRIAPGAKQVLYQPNPIGYIEMWGGNHEVFEECGRILPAFGAYENKLTILPAVGIGKADYANEHAAVSAARGEGGWTVKLVPVQALADAKLTLRSGEASNTLTFSAAPDKPFTATLRAPAEKVSLTLVNAAGQTLLDQTLPIDVGPLPEAEFPAVQARVKGTMPGGDGLYGEATDLVTEHGRNLPRVASANVQRLATSEDSPTLLDAARQLMRVRKGSPEALAALDKVLTGQPDQAHANLYKAIWLWEADKQAEARACLDKAAGLPGARYLLALDAVAGKDFAAAEKHLTALLAMPVEATFRGKDDPGLALLQPSAYVSATRPKLLLAIVRQAQGRKDSADELLRDLVAGDPALIEAWMLLGDAERLKTLTDRNPSGKAAAEGVVEALRAGRWQGIGRP
jgi:tetratricopeptide (TPR) repeat protein